MTSKTLLIGLFVSILLFSGCVEKSEEGEILDVVTLLPQVEEFLSEHPNADIQAAIWGESAVEQNIEAIRNSCGPQMEIKSYWKVVIKEDDLELEIWVGEETQKAICILKRGMGGPTTTTVITSTSISPTSTIETSITTPITTIPTISTLLTTTTIEEATTTTLKKANTARGFGRIKVMESGIKYVDTTLSFTIMNGAGQTVSDLKMDANGSGCSTALQNLGQLSAGSTKAVSIGSCESKSGGDSFAVDVGFRYDMVVAGTIVKHEERGTIRGAAEPESVKKVLFYETKATYKIDSEYSKFKEELQRRGYVVSKLEIVLSKTVLEKNQPDVLVLSGLSSPLTPTEKAAVFEFVMQEGKGLFICGGTPAANELSIPFGMTIDDAPLEDETDSIEGDKEKFSLGYADNFVYSAGMKSILQGVTQLGFFGGSGISLSGNAKAVVIGDWDTYAPKSSTGMFPKESKPPIAAASIVGNGLVFLLSDGSMFSNSNLEDHSYDNLKFGANIVSWLSINMESTEP